MLKKIPDIVRDGALFIFILTCIFPGISNKFLVGTSIAIWFLMNVIIEKKKCIETFLKPNLLTYSVYFWLICSLLYIILGYDTQLKIYIFSYLRIGIISLIYYYYYKNNLVKNMRLIIIYSITILVIVNLVTIIANINHYNLSRILSTGLKSNYDDIGIGSYPHIYGLIFVLITIISYVVMRLNKVRKKEYQFDKSKLAICRIIGIILFIVTSIIAIYITEFTIAFILLGFAVVLSFIRFKKKGLNILKFGLIIVLAIIFVIPITRIISKNIYENTDSKNLKIRANDIYIFLSEGSTENTIDLKARLEKYEKSINAFKNNILLGSMQNSDDYSKIGTHSELLDLFGKYGIIGSIPFITFLLCLYITQYKTFKIYWSKKTYIVCVIIFNIFMLINTAVFVAPMFMAFCLTPMILKAVEQKYLNGEKNG